MHLLICESIFWLAWTIYLGNHIYHWYTHWKENWHMSLCEVQGVLSYGNCSENWFYSLNELGYMWFYTDHFRIYSPINLIFVPYVQPNYNVLPHLYSRQARNIFDQILFGLASRVDFHWKKLNPNQTAFSYLQFPSFDQGTYFSCTWGAKQPRGASRKKTAFHGAPLWKQNATAPSDAW